LSERIVGSAFDIRVHDEFQNRAKVVLKERAVS
jgi:hypothetical protein